MKTAFRVTCPITGETVTRTSDHAYTHALAVRAHVMRGTKLEKMEGVVSFHAGEANANKALSAMRSKLVRYGWTLLNICLAPVEPSVIKSTTPADKATTLPSGAKESVVSKNTKSTKPASAKDVEDLLGKPVKKAVSGKPGAPAKSATAKKAVGQRSDLAGKSLKSAGKEARGLRAVVVEIANGKTYEDAIKALVKSAKFEAPRSKARNADKEAFAKNRIARMVALGLLIAK